MENKLRSMVDFVLEVEKESYTQTEKYNIIEWQNKCLGFEKIVKYAEFLKRPLELWMFVPCYFRNGIWIPYTKETLLNLIELFTEFEEAKSNVLFEGISIQNTKDWIEFYGGIRVFVKTNEPSKMFSFVFRENEPVTKTLEDLVKYNLTLTNNALNIWE